MTQQPEPDREPSAEDPTRAIASPKKAGNYPPKIGRYTIQKKLGQGGMGAVYLAVDTVLKRNIALKVLPQDKAENPTLVRRFKAEAQAAAHLRHDNIIAIFDAGEADGYLFIALEYVDGTDAANLVAKRGVLPVKRSIEIIRQVAMALQHAAEHKIVHRDIKPGNLMIRRDGVVKLADMGLARIVDETADTSITRTGTTVGTVDYMSPEQGRDSKAADVRSDIYSLGCAWYFMLTGGPPFPEGGVTNKLQAHFKTPFPDPRVKNPSVSEPVTAVIRRMTEKDPSKRYQTAEDLIADLTEVLEGGNRVSDAIMSEETETEGTSRTRSNIAEDDEEPSAKGAAASARRRRKISVAEMPVSNLKPSDKERPQGISEWFHQATFYGVCGLVTIGLIAGVIWLVGQMNRAVDTEEGDLGKVAENDKRNSNQKRLGGDGKQIIEGGKSGQVDPNGRKIGESDGNENTVLGGTAKESEAGETNLRLGAAEDDFFDVDKPAASSAKKPGGKKVTRERDELGKLPTWVRETRTMPSKSFVVDPRATGKQDYSTLNLALRDLPREGGRIILTGPGPFPVRVDHIRDCGRVVIEAADEADHPLIVLLEPDNASVHAFLTFENTSLELNNVHIATNVTGFSTSASDALIHVHGGDLLARGCSFSARGVPNTGMTALRVTSPAAGIKSSATKATEDNGRRNILVSKCVVRGRKLTSVLAEVPQGEVVIHDSLLLSGDSPALRLGGAEGDGSGFRNRLILSAATVVAAQNALECTLPSSLNSDWQIAVIATNSLVSSSDAGAAGSLLKVFSLEADKASSILGKKLRWKTTASLFPGWKALIKRDDDATPLATSSTQWQLLWQDPGSSDKSFPRKGWPADFPADVCETSLAVFDRETLGSAGVEVAGGGNPGCSVKDLQSTGLAGMDSMLTMGRRPLVPDGIFGGRGVVEELRVDLTREDLGKVLASKKLTNGTTVIASGAGACLSSPVVIRDAWVRLRFAQTPGKPLVLMPKQNSAPENSPDALISVIHGGIEIQGGVLLAAGLGSKVSAPKYLISAIDSDVALNQCRLQGVLGGAAGRSKGLIEWRRSDNPVAPARPFASDRLAYLVVGESFLLGSGTLVDADVGQRVLLFHRSVALSRNDLFSFRMRESDGAMEGVVDLEQSTLSALDTYLKVDSPTTARGAASPLQFYADRCVFGPALKRTGRAQPSTLMSVAGSALAGGQIRWWEISCGYAPDVGCLLRDDTEAPVVQDFKEMWVQQWGADNCLSPLVGSQEIVLRDELPAKPGELSDLETSRFALHSNCRAASWDGGASPIGARVDQLHVPSPQVAFTPSGSKKTKPNKPKQTVEGF